MTERGKVNPSSAARLSRRRFFPLLALGAAGCSRDEGRPSSSAAETSLRRAADYLWKRQSSDGGWHSSTYGLLRSGQSLTPFVFDALLSIPQSIVPINVPMNVPMKEMNEIDEITDRSVKAALDFIAAQTSDDGALGMSDPAGPDYPNYATALAVKALARSADWSTRMPLYVQYLRGQQLTEQNGWSPEDPCYGAWGMGGLPRTPPKPGQVDLSMTRYVIEALAATGVPTAGPAFQKARVFIERCQNLYPGEDDPGDGGFYFSTVVVGANKAGFDGSRFLSYGTATADGVLSLLALGYPADHERVAAARKWLEANHSADGAPGFVSEPTRRWTQGLRYYYAAAAARAFHGLGLTPQPALTPRLCDEQRPDGSWSNPDNLVKEDDPLIATGLAVRALTAEIASTT